MADRTVVTGLVPFTVTSVTFDELLRLANEGLTALAETGKDVEGFVITRCDIKRNGDGWIARFTAGDVNG